MQQDSEHNASSFLAKQNTAMLFLNKTDLLFQIKNGSIEAAYTHASQLCFQSLHICIYYSNNNELTKVFKEPYTEFKAL